MSNEIEDMIDSPDVMYLVSTTRMSPRVDDIEVTVPMVDIIGLFHTVEEAFTCAESHRVLDSTLLDEPTITPVVPTYLESYNVLFKLFFADNKLYIQSRLADPKASVYVTETDEFFEALVKPEDINIFIERARMWHGDVIGGEFVIVDEVPDEAIDIVGDVL